MASMNALNWRKKGAKPSTWKIQVLGSKDNMALEGMVIKDINNNGAYVHMTNYDAERILSRQLQVFLYFISNIPPNCRYLATHVFPSDYKLPGNIKSIATWAVVVPGFV